VRSRLGGHREVDAESSFAPEVDVLTFDVRITVVARGASIDERAGDEVDSSRDARDEGRPG
jgi:hypothetical protein